MRISTTTLRVGEVYAGPYVDGRPGAVLMVNAEIAHLSPERCQRLAEVLLLSADGEPQLAQLLTRLTVAQRRQLALLLQNCAASESEVEVQTL